MKDIFDANDSQNQGFIKTSQLGNILRLIGHNPLDADIERAMREFDPQS